MKTNNPFFSVIVPVYKVESYLAKCIDSVLNQTFTDFELILVDDGSPDNCPQICDEYAQKDTRIRVIHQKNGGISKARNAGLDAISCSKGKTDNSGYIIFLDSDDSFRDNTTFQQLHDRIITFAEDVVLYGCWQIEANGYGHQTRGNYDVQILDQHNKNKSLAYLWKTGEIPGSCWIMAVKFSLIEGQNLRFKIGVTAEDYEWIFVILATCERIGAIRGSHYAYIRRDGSITSEARISGYWGINNAIDRYFAMSVTEPTLAKYVCKIYMITVLMYNDLRPENKKEGKVLLKKYLPVLKQAQQSKYYWFIKLMGFHISSVAMKYIHKKRHGYA